MYTEKDIFNQINTDKIIDEFAKIKQEEGLYKKIVIKFIFQFL